MTPSNVYSTVEERIGKIKGILEPLPGEIREIYERLNKKDTWGVQVENDIKAVKHQTEEVVVAFNELVEKWNNTPQFDPLRCQTCSDQVKKIEPLWTDLQERQQNKVQTKTERKSTFLYVVDKLITIIVTIITAYLLLRFGLATP